MKLTMGLTEIETAIRKHIRTELGFGEGTKITIDLSGNGWVNNKADIDIVPEVAQPKPVVVTEGGEPAAPSQPRRSLFGAYLRSTVPQTPAEVVPTAVAPPVSKAAPTPSGKGKSARPRKSRMLLH